MKCKFNRAYYSQGRIFLPLLILLFSLSVGNTFAQEKKTKKKTKTKTTPLEFTFGLETTYDDNILKYSDKYLERFMNGEDEGRFHIKTYDDLILNPSLAGAYSINIFKKVESKFSASFSPRIYVVNSIKNWLYWGIGFQQYLSKKASFKISYGYIPEFYVRHFRDDQWIDVYGYEPIAFTPYAFAKDNFGFYIQNTFFKNTRLKFSLNHARYYHNKHYTEYDSKDWLYGFYIYQRIVKKFSIDAGYQYVTSDAKGYDASYQTPETTTGPDATFVEDRFNFGFLWYLPKINKKSNNLNVDLLIMYRYYSSAYPPLVDPLHAGRYDHNYRLFFKYNFSMTKSLKLTLFYNWLMRDTDTKAEINSVYVSNEKDYRQDQIGIKIVYGLKLSTSRSEKIITKE